MGAKKPLTILQISDPHLYADTSRDLLGINTEESFCAVVKQVLAEKCKPDILLLTGDLAQDGSEAAYLRIAATVKPFNCPVYWIPGNHDAPAVMQKVFAETHLRSEKSIINGRWQIILLDTHKPGAVEGLLAAREYTHLQNCLQNNADLYVLLVLHHHVIPIACRWLDKLALEDAAQFLKIIKAFPNVKGVFCGHIHQVFEKTVDGIFYASVPSTCIQFTPKSDDFALDEVAPGYRWIFLHNDGRIETNVQRTKHYKFKVDPNATGY